jgi:hypothetical protein
MAGQIGKFARQCEAAKPPRQFQLQRWIASLRRQ